jgi:hypothetical protein
MKVKEAIELINNKERPCYSIHEAAALLKLGTPTLTTITNSDSGWYEISSFYYQLEDGILELRGVTRIFDNEDYVTFYDVGIPCRAFVVSQCTNKKQYNMNVFDTLTQFIKRLYNSIVHQKTKYTTIYAGVYTVEDEYILKRGKETLLILGKSFDVTTNKDLYLVRSDDGVVRICEVTRHDDRVFITMRYYKYLQDQKEDEVLYFYGTSK